MTKAYVGRVLDAIYTVEAEVIRLQAQAAANGASAQPKAAVDLLPTIYQGDQLTFSLYDIANDWEDGKLIMDFKADPKPSTVDVQSIVDVDPGCIIATFLIDDGPTVNYDPDPVELIAALESKPADADPNGVNTSPWVMTVQRVMNPNVEASCGG